MNCILEVGPEIRVESDALKLGVNGLSLNIGKCYPRNPIPIVTKAYSMLGFMKRVALILWTAYFGIYFYVVRVHQTVDTFKITNDIIYEKIE